MIATILFLTSCESGGPWCVSSPSKSLRHRFFQEEGAFRSGYEEVAPFLTRPLGDSFSLLPQSYLPVLHRTFS